MHFLRSGSRISKVLSAGGFTLVELMIAVAIIAIIAAIAVGKSGLNPGEDAV